MCAAATWQHENIRKPKPIQHYSFTLDAEKFGAKNKEALSKGKYTNFNSEDSS